MSCNLCPVRQVIDEYYGGGGEPDDDQQIIKLGGDDCIYVCDEVSYYMISRKMEVARFKLTNPSAQEIQNKVRSMFGHILGQDYTFVYTQIIGATINKPYLQDQFARLIQLIEKMKCLILAKANKWARAGQKINIYLPDLRFEPDVILVYRPDVLCAITNQLIMRVNSIDITSLIAYPPEKLDQVILPDLHPPDMKTIIPARADDLDSILSHEMRVAQYISEIEKYQCYVINQMNRIFDFCKKIISELIA